MNSRWQANKIGLINFWYYDEQEFPFVKGRMLLRGANGSGKSVTMQSVVPLLLDGNMSPERLDPFGSRDRKMSSYLLEEEDDRDERTGYLYLEFKRKESDTYLTVGMGIRARKGKPLDKWYFGLTDGRRINHDFFLYKETDEKMALSKKELENRIQNGGCVFDRQADYMEFVNRQVFGFESVDEYKEMIDLLIQLRTPKLSKDFKPSIINEILSDSLQPLSDEDLRPMSEAIENMDNMNMNLKTRREGLQAAEKINREFDKYNKVTLFEKSGRLENTKNSLNKLKKEDEQRKKEIDKCMQRVQELEQENIELSAKKDAMEKEKESLNKSDAVGLKEKETELKKQITDKEVEQKQKEKQISEKEQQHKSLKAKKKDEENREYEKNRELMEYLSEMQEEADMMEFHEHNFFADEFEKAIQSSFSFDTHEKEFEKTKKLIEDGVKLFKEVDLKERERDEVLQKKDRLQKEIDKKQREAKEKETLFVQIQNERKEKFYSWNGSNGELILSAEQLKELAHFVEDYDEKSDFGKMRQKVSDVKIKLAGDIDSEIRRKEEENSMLKDELKQQNILLSEWENHKEPEPERSEAVLRNRERLQSLGIPYQEFYKVIEFGNDMDKKSCDRLEEALAYMGILDALVIDEQYRDKVLTMESGCHDSYLFVQNQRAEKSLLDVLELNDSVNDIFLNQTLTGILANIAYDTDGATSISKDGTYKIGVLTGTLTGEYEAGFLGSRAREKNRLAKIKECKVAISELENAIGILEGELKILSERRSKLDAEYNAFPGIDDLSEAYKMLQDVSRELEQLNKDGGKLDKELAEVNEILKEIKTEAIRIAEKLYLTGNLETFQAASDACLNYDKLLVKLKAGHEIYLRIIQSIQEYEERMKESDDDMDTLKYDLKRIKKSLASLNQEYESVSEQLKLTDYEQIKDRLDECMTWLGDYPEMLTVCAEEKTTNKNQIFTLERQCEKAAEEISTLEKRNEYFKKCYDEELKLGYVVLPDEILVDEKAVYNYLSTDCKTLDKEKISYDLSKSFVDNLSFLSDYQPSRDFIFNEEINAEYPSARRINIMAKYRGEKIPFNKLPEYLRQEIEELQELIKAGDRELFEDILANTVSRKIRGRINASNKWVENMNALMNAMNTSSGLKLNLRWRSKTAESEDQLDTKELVELLKKDYRIMREDEAEKLSLHFRSKVDEARRKAQDNGGMVSFYQVMKETLDYRKWFEFQLFSQKSGERQKELTNSVFGTFSGGEKAMSMYVPLFSAVVAKYKGGREDAPRLVSLDEAFAGVDNKNIRDMFRLMTEFEFDFIINSQVLWGDCDTLDALAIYQLVRPENAKFVTVMPYIWNGKSKEMLESEGAMERRAAELGN
jgi:uncharacterized protein (TIGR02680 family)